MKLFNNDVKDEVRFC